MKIQRNEPCICGSGKKYKKCCGLTGKDEIRGQSETRLSVELNLLITLLQGGHNPELVEAKARELTVRHPNSGLAWKVLAASCKLQGKDALEALQKAALLLPHDAEAHNNLGNALLLLGQFDVASASYRRAVEIKPDFAEAHCNLSAALLQLDQPKAAMTSSRRALQIRPEYAQALNNLGLALLKLDQPEEALNSCHQALELKPDLVEALDNVKAALTMLGLGSEASCRERLETNPDNTLAIMRLANMCISQGRFTEAEELFKRAASIAPDMPDAWIGIPHSRKMTSADTSWLVGALRVVGLNLEPRKQAALHFAIAKYFDDLEDFEQAFTHYQRANELSKRYMPKYDPRHTARLFDQLIQFHDRERQSQVRIAANTSVRPVFVVGMPRSGTTLAEQILASHPSIFGAGELNFWGDTIRGCLFSQQRANMLTNAAADYLRQLEERSADALRVVDKMPHNFQYLGLLNAVLPNARIIHMKRNPLDTCLSIYFQNFNTNHPYSNDLTSLAGYYDEYLRLMKHWQSTLPAEAFLEVCYEDLVSEQAAWSRKMIEFVGLPWDPRCLDFHQTSRGIATPSRWQVRQKISKSSVARWRNYEKYVEPLLRLRND